MLKSFNTRYGCALVLSATVGFASTAFGATVVRYVDDNASLSGNGTSWATAFRYLQDALESARVHVQGTPADTVEIWVAAGTYRPDLAEGTVNGETITQTDRAETFNLRNKVHLHGGFVGNETGVNAFNNRRPLTNLTILTGEINTASISDNSYHVVTANRVDTTAWIDGFIVKHGYANDAPAPETGVPAGGGGGLIIFGDEVGQGSTSRPIVLRITFTDNTADFGGAVYIYTGQTTNGTQFYNCEFRNNEAGDGNGGAVRSQLRGQAGTVLPAGVETFFVNCLFADNEASGSGGAAAFGSVDVGEFDNCTIASNSAGGYGGGLFHNSSGPCDAQALGFLHVYDSILWGNESNSGSTEQQQIYGLRALAYCCLQGLTSQTCHSNSISSDPLFETGTYRLSSTSPCLNAGDAALADTYDLSQELFLCGYTPDLDLELRVVNGDVDMGCYERQRDCPLDIAPQPTPDG